MTYRSDKNQDGETEVGHLGFVLEDAKQRQVAESPTWLIAAQLNAVRGSYDMRGQDSRDELEGLGFTILTRKGLFYKVTPPPGWTKETDGYWTYVYDDQHTKKLSQFFKGALWDTRAHVSISLSSLWYTRQRKKGEEAFRKERGDR